MARIELQDGMVLYDDIEDLRGNERDKNLEKVFGPQAVITLAGGRLWHVRLCPMCRCIKSFDRDTPNTVLEGCDGECPCHDA